MRRSGFSLQAGVGGEKKKKRIKGTRAGDTGLERVG